MAVYFAIFQILPTFVYELFETMQSSVTRSKTSITKSLPASFKFSIFTLSSESYNKTHCFFAEKCSIISYNLHLYLNLLKKISKLFKRLQNVSNPFIFPSKNRYIDYCKQFHLHVITKNHVQLF